MESEAQNERKGLTLFYFEARLVLCCREFIYRVACLFDGNLDCKLQRLDEALLGRTGTETGTGMRQVLTVDEHRAERTTTTYNLRKKT
ncbi:hypothetical protein V1525DRAFT_392079 [Lipomyces kononenkoae]|uniref:Uncharacterized protein n=1 Tax=Lipomyces kononenkoae TaxID=34357 RepID=A0ACC3SQA5_LIPKO